LWLSLGSGLARVQWPSAFTYFGRANGLDIGSRYAVVRHRGALYVANTRGLFRLARGHPPASSAHFERVFAGETWDIEPWHDGLLLTMTRDLRWLTPGGEVRSIHRSPGATRFSVARASALDTNRIWLGQSDGMRSLYYGDGAWRDEGLVAGVTGNIATIVEDGERTLWCAGPGTGFVRVRFAASTAGAARPAVADVTQFTAGHGLPQTVSTGGAVRWGDEILFTISGSNALLRFNAARDAFEPAPGLQVVDEAIALTPGSGQPGHVWLAADDSQPSEWRIHRVERDGKFLALPQTTNQPIGAAFRFLEEPNPDGDVLWVGGNEGLMRVDLTRAFAPPTPLVAQVRPIGFSSGAQRSYAERDVELAYFAPRFQTGAVVDYQSRLEGYEGAWSDWSAARKRSFTNLPPGSYRFVVRARDTDGMMSAPVDVAFAILPPWWRTWWFLGLVGLSGIGGVAGITRWFATRALRRRVALLEAQSAVERERLRLARDLHDEVGSGLGRVILFAGEADRTVGDPTKQRAALARVRGAAQELVQHAREIVWAVSPQHDTLASVIERLGDYADETLRAAGIACAVQSPPAEKIPPLTLGSEARHSLFLALKEAVHNCVKYSGAKTAELTLAIVGDAFVITLRDYGRGFAPGERRGSGNGTKNIIARAEALGGSAEIVSEPGKGTTVVLRVPLR
jgi:signal transduction histidine kinase